MRTPSSLPSMNSTPSDSAACTGVLSWKSGIFFMPFDSHMDRPPAASATACRRALCCNWGSRAV